MCHQWNTLVKKILAVNGFCFLAFGASSAHAAGGVQFINFYQMILHGFGLDSHAAHDWQAVVGASLVVAFLTLVGIAFRAHCVRKLQGEVAPDSGFSLMVFVEMVLDFVCNLASDIIGAARYRPFMPLLAGLFLFIFTCNLSGLVPGFPPATESLNTNLAMALSVFLVYNVAGIREHGPGYIKQFMGPMLFLMPLIFLIELIAHLARPISLSLRLYGNIFGDHLVLSVFTGLTFVIFPALLLFFGLLVASVQSFVFTLLSSIYISLAISHDH